MPGNARYRARLATLDPPSRVAALRDAVALNPYYSAGWIELGLRAEMSRDFETAERCLLQAAKVDKTYQPRWTLANYYFRRDDRKEFWVWAGEAAAMAYQDQTALFELCWRATEDPRVILQRVLPERRDVIAQYLSYLMRSGRLEAAEPVAARLLDQGDRSDRGLLFNYCDRLLEEGRAEAAVRLWNSLTEKGFIPYPALAPEHGDSLTNGDFRSDPVLHGFDWRFHLPGGVSLSRLRAPPTLKVTFTGGQPERLRVIEQILPLEPSRHYRLRFEYRASGIAPGSGPRWEIADAASGKPLSPSPADLFEQDWAEELLTFSTPPGVRLGRLSLIYQRVPGTTRIEGSVFLRLVSLDLQ